MKRKGSQRISGLMIKCLAWSIINQVVNVLIVQKIFASVIVGNAFKLRVKCALIRKERACLIIWRVQSGALASAATQTQLLNIAHQVPYMVTETRKLRFFAVLNHISSQVKNQQVRIKMCSRVIEITKCLPIVPA